ncbi:MAG: hypothetical protein U1A73_16435 [Pseudomonas sp.]|nr:hypothetical protein [Pseudomonas sp.]
MSNLLIQPRILRAREAPKYLGMCRAVFDQTVRPYVNEFPIGMRGVGFDRIELDKWADAYILAHSIEKGKTAESPQLEPAPPKSKRKKRGPVLAVPISKPFQRTTAEDFHRLVAEILGKPATKNDRRRQKQNHQQPPTEE